MVLVPRFSCLHYRLPGNHICSTITDRTSTLNSILYMIVTNIADTFITPAPTDFPVLFSDRTHPKVTRTSDHHNGRGRFGSQSQHIINRMRLIIRPLKNLSTKVEEWERKYQP